MEHRIEFKITFSMHFLRNSGTGPLKISSRNTLIAAFLLFLSACGGPEIILHDTIKPPMQFDHVARIGENLINEFDFSVDELDRSLDELVRREKLGEPAVAAILPLLKDRHLVSPDFQTSVKPRPIEETRGGVVIKLGGNFDPWIPERIDYLHDYR